MIRRLSLLALVLTLGGCMAEEGVTQVHIDRATALCEPNGGLKRISKAERMQELESCGYRCARGTGNYEHTLSATCRNGASFSQVFMAPGSRQ